MSAEQRRELGTAYDAEEFPEGLRCIDCHRLLQEGDNYCRRPFAADRWGDAPIIYCELVCTTCILIPEEP